MVLGLPDLIEPQTDKPQVGLAGLDLLGGLELDLAGDPVADADRLGAERDLAGDGAVARPEQLFGRDVVEGMAVLGAGESRSVDRVERRRGRAGVAREAAQTTEIDAEGHRFTLRCHEPGRQTTGWLPCGRHGSRNVGP